MPTRPQSGWRRPSRCFERTLADYEHVLGETHHTTLTTRNNLALAYQDAGRLAEAEGLRNRTEP